MKTFKQLFNENAEKVAFFNKRTKEHIDRVKKNAAFIEKRFPDLKGLVKQTSTHDQSKYEKPEVDPYIELTWLYKIKEKADKELAKSIKTAVKHHYKSNKHHPEYWSNPSKMDDLSIAEMVCDWQAMSQEYNEGSCRGWADKNIGVRWKFTDKQKELIYSIIDAFEDETT